MRCSIIECWKRSRSRLETEPITSGYRSTKGTEMIGAREDSLVFMCA
jgi:hypothetical protein